MANHGPFRNPFFRGDARQDGYDIPFLLGGLRGSIVQSAALGSSLSGLFIDPRKFGKDVDDAISHFASNHEYSACGVER